MEEILNFTEELKLFFTDLGFYLTKKLHFSFLKIEEGKGIFVTSLYKERGKMARKLMSLDQSN